ncbi:MAG: AAA family ATPase [ANME-2 cluster archaeon]|nr:AAA family ATPase [ANME-2 cluster archaeon]
MEPKNPELHLAGDFIRETGCHIFLTGKAGTGKTTFLRSVKEITPKRMIITAPTGVAAIAHEAIRTYLDIPQLSCLFQKGDKYFKILLARENILSTPATIHDVIPGPRIFYS